MAGATTTRLKTLLSSRECTWSNVIGMIHVQALPGAPKSKLSMEELVSRVRKEADVYRRNGLHGVIVENMHDVPYVRGGGGGGAPEVTASMTRLASEVRNVIGDQMILGIQILSGANKEAMAVAKATGADFIRAEGFVFSHVGDEGWMDSCAGELLRYRKQIDADSVDVWTDIKKKHCSHVVTSDLRISEVARAAEFFCSDGLIVTGAETTIPADLKEVEEVREATTLPLILGSGVTRDNLEDYYGRVDAMIVGSCFKVGGRWHGDVDEKCVQEFMSKHRTMNSRRGM